MECPNCKHEAPPVALVKCSSCGKVYERKLLEEYEHVGYLIRWLGEHHEQAGINADALNTELATRRTELERQMHIGVPPSEEVKAEAPLPPTVEIAPVQDVAAAVPVEEPVSSPEPPSAPEVASVPATPILSQSVSTSKPTPLQRKPARAPINWSKIWDSTVKFVISGALLRALLYMGAFMIVVSAAVLVINFWSIFPAYMQIVFIFALPTAFYAVGWLVRTRLKLFQAGTVITGIGAVLLTVDFAALYQFAHLNMDVNVYWFAASMISTVIYVFTAFRLEGKFFDYLMLLGGVNSLLALTRVLNIPLEWTIASVPFAGAGMVGLAVTLWEHGDDRRDMAQAARYLPQVLMPLSLLAVLVAGGPGSRAGIMTAFLCAAVAYGLLAWKFASVWQLIPGLINLAIASTFGVWLLDSKGVWQASAGAVLSAGYVLAGWKFFGKENAFRLNVSYRRAFYGMGFVIALLAFIAGLIMIALGNRLEAAVALTLLALSFCAWDVLLRQPPLGFVGAGMLLIPFWLLLDLVHVQSGFYPLAYFLLISFAYFPAGILIGCLDKKLAAPIDWTGWLVSCIVFFSVFFPDEKSPAWIPALTLTLLTAYYSFNAWHFRYAIFAWGAALACPLAVAQWLNVWNVPLEQAALVWAVSAFVYLFSERFLNQQKEIARFRWPFGLGSIGLAFIALLVSFIAFFETYENLNRVPLALLAQGMIVLLTILAARLYHSRGPLFIEPFLSTLLAVLFIIAYAPGLLGYSLDWFQFSLVFCGAAWIHLLIAAGMDHLSTRYSHGLYLGGYGLATLATIWAIADRLTLLLTLGAFITVMSASAVLAHFNRHHTWDDFVRHFGAPASTFARVLRGAFLWPTAWLFPLWCVLLLSHWEVPEAFRWLALGVPALLYLALGAQLAKRESTYSWPFFSAAHAYMLIAFSFSIDRVLTSADSVATGRFLGAINASDLPIRIAQGFDQLLSVVFYGAWAWMKRQRFFAHVAAWLGILPFTSFLLTLTGISARQVVIAWASWAVLLLLIGFLLDRLKEGLPRFSHGPYMAGYAVAAFALLISTTDRLLNLIVLGMFIAVAALSFVAVYFDRHRTLNDLASLFGAPHTIPARLVRGAFLWLAAWLFPIWCMQLLIYLQTPEPFRWLGFGVPPLLYLVLGAQLVKRDSTYSWPIFSAAHVFMAIALSSNVDRVLASSSRMIWNLSLSPMPASTQISIGQGIVQLTAVTYYAGWAWLKRQRFFAHVAAWLSILPFTSLLLVLANATVDKIVVAWAGWAVALMLVGFLLDQVREGSPRHAHGPYLAGYALAFFTLFLTPTMRRLNVIVLGMSIIAAVLSFVAVHFKLHRAFDDFVNLFWRKDTLIKRGVRLLFLFFAVYALPVWVMQLEAYYDLSMAWQGVSLALLAPLLIACGLFLRRLNPDYTWPFYSAGYVLTALGAMIAFDDQRLTIYVLVLDIAVYAVSSVIFRQPFWLYLATCLTPITVLMALHYNDRFTPQWIAWAFSALSLIYFCIGQLLERRKAGPAIIAPFAMPFYAPGYLLSVIALVLASGDRSLALGIYPINIGLYALSAWRFHEPLFLYPAVWLSIVPYRLFLTRFFTIPLEWLGTAWLPLILFFIGLGRFIFHKNPLVLKTPRAIIASLTHSAVPFYSIAYALTVTMVLDSRWTPVSLTVACAAATVLYLTSALLFRHPAWLYPTLFTAHLTIFAYFTIHPSGSPVRFISFPFLALTWLEALAGYFVSRRYPVTEIKASGRLVFKFFGHEFEFGAFPFMGYLAVPSWAQPIFIVVALDTLLWEGLALNSLDTGVWVSAGFFLLFALFAMLWQDQLLAHLSLVFGVLAASYELVVLDATMIQVFASLSGIALVLYLLSWLVEWLDEGTFLIWCRPLTNVAVALSVISLAVTLPTVFSETISAAFTLGTAGALYLTISLRRRSPLLGYFGMGLLITGWSLFLFVRNVEQPQFYAVPAGLYFTGMGFFERARRPGRFALLIESLGLALLLVTSFSQSLSGKTGFPYFLLLLVEGLLTIWWGAARHLRVPFIIGLSASVVNVFAQVAVLVRVYDVNRWIIIFGVGILLVGLGLFVERRRERLLARAQELRDMLERWE